MKDDPNRYPDEPAGPDQPAPGPSRARRPRTGPDPIGTPPVRRPPAAGPADGQRPRHRAAEPESEPARDPRDMDASRDIDAPRPGPGRRPAGGEPRGGPRSRPRHGHDETADDGEPTTAGAGVIGRARVRPYRPAGPARTGAEAFSPDDGDGPNGPAGPGGGGSDGAGPGGGGPDDPDDGPLSAAGQRARRSKKARRRNILVASFAVLIMLTGVGVVGGAYYVDSIKTPDELTFPESTTLYYNDGKTVLAKVGDVTRYDLTFDQLNDAVKEAIVASEDKTFWTNSGVEFSSVLRAAWNNVTGGEVQGASTITQQYARLAFDLQGATFGRKIREAILAWKLDNKLPKEKILEYYLNAVAFGRNTYGIEAAAIAFFGKTANKNAPAAQQLTKADAMVLVSMVKQPEPNPQDPKNQPGYDPTYSPLALQQAQQRFEYVRQQMKDLGYLTPAEDAKLQFPLKEVKKYDPSVNVGFGADKPAGLVINHILSELSHSNSQFNGMPWQDIRDGGYKIYTTLNAGAQSAAEKAADESIKGSFMYGQPKGLQAALVAVEPGTGRVLAYYGGNDGKGTDYAGIYFDEKGEGNGFGRYPAGSSFKIYTLAAALNSGVSLNSYWESKAHDLPGRTGKNQVRNASTCPTGADKPCSLLNSTIASLNVPFYEVTMSVGAQKVLDMARAAGVDYMWNDARVRQPLAGADLSKLVPSTFDTVLGIGQYPITVMDHANGVATFAAGGLRATAHFVTKVVDGDKTVYSETLPTGKEKRILSPEAENDLTYALSQVSAAKLTNGWDTAGKTGTWELNANNDENADAWMVGFTRRLAAAVWVGNKGAEKALRDRSNSEIYGAGIPASIWRSFMTNATKAMHLDPKGTTFARPSYAGDTSPPGSIPSPAPSQQPPDNPICRFIFCPPGRRG